MVNAYRTGDALALAEVEQVARYLAQGIINCINFVNPDLIILGDEYVAFGDDFLIALNKHVKAAILPDIYKNIRLQMAKIEGDIVLKGSFLYVLNHTLFAPSTLQK